MSKVLVINPAECDGCRSCELVCSLVKEGESGIYKSRIKIMRFPDEYFFYPNVCLQCEIAYCALVCPTAALFKNFETGVIELAPDKCVGCKMCLVACPFGAISMAGATAVKCDLCQGDPACVKFCEPKALTYGEPEDISIGKRVVVAEKVKETRTAIA